MMDSDKHLTKILHAYDLDARQSIASLSKKLGLTRDIINRHIDALEKSKVISGYITLIDIGKLGYFGIAVYARLDTANQKKRENFFSYLKKKKEIYWVANLGGKYDILFAIQASSIVHFSDILNEILKNYTFVTGSQFAIRMKAMQFQRAYLVPRPTKRIQGGFDSGYTQEFLKQREKIVLKILIEEPQVSVIELARRVRLSRITVKTIISNLTQRGIIQKFSSLISASSLGLQCYIILITLKRFDKSTRDKLQRFANEESSIIFCIETVGNWHVEFHCEVSSQEKLQELARRFRCFFQKEISLIEIIPVFEYYVKYKYHLE